MSAVARRAGVGVATLYRRFPTRAELVTAAFTEQLGLCAAALDEALADPDPAHGLYVLPENVCATQVTDRGFASVFLEQFPDALDRERERAEEGLARQVQRARESGQLRDDFDLADVTLLLLAHKASPDSRGKSPSRPPGACWPISSRRSRYSAPALSRYPR
jgi:AcrR family transcriptional regulator